MRWLPLPVAAGRAPALARVSPAARCVWMGLRIAHAEYGTGGTVPAVHGDATGVGLAAPALVAGVDVGAALAELAAAGLVESVADGVRLADWAEDTESAPCSGCRRRNPDPRHSRCPACRARGADPTRRRRRRGATGAQTERDQDADSMRPADADPVRPGPDQTRPDQTRTHGWMDGPVPTAPVSEGRTQRPSTSAGSGVAGRQLLRNLARSDGSGGSGIAGRPNGAPSTHRRAPPAEDGR